MRVTVDTAEIAALGDVFADVGRTVQECLPTLRGAPAALESSMVLGSASTAQQYSGAYGGWSANISQLALSLACLARKLHLAANVYGQGESYATVRPAS